MNGYEKTLRVINDYVRIKYILKICCYGATAVSAFVFFYVFSYFIDISIIYAMRYLVCLAIPFVIVSFTRRLVNAKRPYEVYDFYEQRPKGRSGCSFPSRHAFSAFAIGTICLFVYPVLGIFTLVISGMMCVCRVLLGIHFIRDVIGGAIVGVLSSLIGTLILL